MFTDHEGRLYPTWSFLLSVALTAVVLFASGYLAATLAGVHVLRFEFVFRTALALLLLAGYSWLLTVANHVESRRLAAQGLPRGASSGRLFLAGSVIGLALVAVTVAAMVMGGGVTYRITTGGSAAQRILLVLFVLLMGSLAEELMFRGYPFQRLVEAVGPGGAILVFSVLFALMHLLNPGASPLGMLNTVVIGIGLSVAYLRTRSLWLPWGFHFAWNASMGLLFGLPVSGLRLFNVVVHATPGGPRLLTGGTYGPEASIPGAVAVLLGTLVMLRAPLRWLGAPVDVPSNSGQRNDLPPVVTEPPHPPSDLGL
jgi:membrane protease YdiL (CAAX protease family)